MHSGHGTGGDRNSGQGQTGIRQEGRGLWPDTVLGVVLAGGHGRRMGGAAKPLMPLAGVPMALWVAAALRQGTGAVVLATGSETARYASLGFPCLSDPPLPLTGADAGRAGPLAGILAGLEYAAAHRYGWVLTCPADVPLVPPTLGPRLRDALQRSAAGGRLPPGITVEAPPAEAGGEARWHPAIALLSVSLAPLLRQALLAGERRVGGWMRQVAPLRLRWPDSGGSSAAVDPFSNINTPEDLRQAAEALASSAAAGDPPGREGA